MNSKTRVLASMALILFASAQTWAAPSLPVTKPPVGPNPSHTGPVGDSHAVSGQWFRVVGSDTLTVRSHEFHDNTQGNGGGWVTTLAIVGRVTNVVFDTSIPVPTPPIIAFDIVAAVYNDLPGEGTWLNGTNSHGEMQSATSGATGTMMGVVLTADFAMSDPTNKPRNFNPPYRTPGPAIVATNMDLLGWYCWDPASGLIPEGGFYVPAWDFGNIAPGGGVVRTLQFVVPEGLPFTDPRWAIINQSQETGADVLLNRSLSLKISNWIDDMGIDTGAPYPTNPPLVASDVSVFHDVEGETPTNPPAPELGPCPKWLQPPDCPQGLDVESWGWGTLQEYHSIVSIADDWLCDGRPITGLRWWGSYLGWESANPRPDVLPPADPHPVAFLVMWRQDIPARPPEEPFSRPGEVIEWAVYPTQLGIGGDLPGIVWEKPYCVSHLDYIEPGLVEHEYVYDLEFPAANAWNEKEGSVYWLSVQAIYTNPPAAYPWGWKTTPPANNWNDDAVIVKVDVTNEMVYPPFGWGQVTNHPYKGASVNMAFELLTDVCPRRAKKWVQPPDMVEGENMPSFRVMDGSPLNRPLRADDWLCDGRRVSDIHWWGSYLDYKATNSGPVAPPATTAFRPVGFLLSWHTDIPADAGGMGYSYPGDLITNLFVSITNCHEVYYGSVHQPWKGPDVFEHEFQYYVDLLNPDVGSPWLETNGVVYWLNIQAVFPPEFEQGGSGEGSHTGWGWKTTPPTNRWNDASTVTSNGLPWAIGVYPAPPRLKGQPCDLAFELTTDEVGGGTNWWNQPIRITQISKTATTPAALASVGDAGAGVQVLQASTNLVDTNWVSLVTNTLPLPAPNTNMWTDAPAAETTRFYRVMQK